MAELAIVKFAGQAVMVNIAELILECVDSIGSIVRGMKENNRHASQLLEAVEAIEPPIRAIQKKGTKLSGSESLRQLLETVREIRTVLDEYTRTCIVTRVLKRKKIAKKFAWLGSNLTQKMHAVQLDAIADRLEVVPPSPAAGTSIGAPAQNVADVLRQAPKTVGQSTAVGAAAGGTGGALLALGAETVTAAAVANAALAGALCTGIVGVAVGVGIVTYKAMNCAQPNQADS
ncbi:unnamed protein product [Ectocarpus fasciculatus]